LHFIPSDFFGNALILFCFWGALPMRPALLKFVSIRWWWPTVILEEVGVFGLLVRPAVGGVWKNSVRFILNFLQLPQTSHPRMDIPIS